MKPQKDLALKGREAEEWWDLVFFRPLGGIVARRLKDTQVTPNQVTLLALVTGLIAGHLVAYPRWWTSLLAFVIFIVSEIFDCADGQLARMKNMQSRRGRMVDGYADNLRFINLWVHVLIRALVQGSPTWTAVVIVVAAGLSHSWQALAVDFIRNVYLVLGTGKRSAQDLPEDCTVTETAGIWRLGEVLYLDYTKRQEWMFPRTARLMREVRRVDPGPSLEFQEVYKARQHVTLPISAWIGQPIRFALVAACMIPGWPMGYAWITLLPLNIIFIACIIIHEWNATILVKSLEERAHAA